jgi:dihydroorotase-like cyclic amidohydrolase
MSSRVDLLISNGRLFDPGLNVDYVGDVAIDDGKIVAIGKNLSARYSTNLYLY